MGSPVCVIYGHFGRTAEFIQIAARDDHIQKAFNLSMSGSGDLMSIFSIMGFVLAIPAGYILKRFGIKLTGLVAVGSVAVGSCLGAIAETSRMLFFGRFIEGVGMGLIMVAAPFAISVWFPAQKRALATGIWASSVGIGNVATLLLAPSMAVSYGWRSVWWAGAGFSAFAFILFAILFRMPKKEEMYEAPAPAAAAQEESPSLLKGMANSNFWMISIAFGCYNLVVMAMCSFLPAFLEIGRGYSLTFEKGVLMNASFVTAFIMLASIFSGPVGGRISDRLGKRKMMILIPYILMTLTFAGALYGYRMDDPDVHDYIWNRRRSHCAYSSRGSPGSGKEAPADRNRHVCCSSGPEYRDVYRAFAICPSSGSAGMGCCRVLDDSHLPCRHHCHLEAQGEIEPGSIEYSP